MNFSGILQDVVKSVGPMIAKVAIAIPSVLFAVLLVVGGYFMAKAIGRLVGKALSRVGLDRLGQRVGLAEILVGWNISPLLSQFVGRLLFFTVYLLFLISACEVLGLDGLIVTINKVLDYLPNIVGALLVFMTAAIGGHFAKSALMSTGESMNLSIAKPLSHILYFSILLLGGVLAMGQLKIENDLLVHVIEIGLIAAGATVALSIGFGSRDVAKNLVAGAYAKEVLSVGAQVQVGEIRGELVGMNAINFEVEDTSGNIHFIPNASLVDSIVVQETGAPTKG